MSDPALPKNSTTDLGTTIELRVELKLGRVATAVFHQWQPGQVLKGLERPPFPVRIFAGSNLFGEGEVFREGERMVVRLDRLT